MTSGAKVFVGLVIAFHVLAFVAEAILWMSPAVHGIAVARLNPGLQIDVLQQAAVLRALFINQGFYNLLLALGGLGGLVLLGRGHREAGVALVRYACVFAVGAGLVLLATTSAYAGAFLQAGLGAIALLLTFRGAPAHRVTDAKR